MEFYVIRKSDDDIEHAGHKYIKKKKVNGKWRYYYDESANELTTLRKDAVKKNKAFEDSWNKYNKAMYIVDKTRAKLERRYYRDGEENVERWYNNPSITLHRKQGYGERGGKGHLLRWKADRAQYDYDERKASLGGKVDSFMEKNGKTIAKKLNKASKSINKGKQAVNKLITSFKKKKKIH